MDREEGRRRNLPERGPAEEISEEEQAEPWAIRDKILTAHTRVRLEAYRTHLREWDGDDE